MNTHTCAYIHKHIYAYTHKHILRRRYTHIRIHTLAYKHIHTRTHTHTHMQMLVLISKVDPGVSVFEVPSTGQTSMGTLEKTANSMQGGFASFVTGNSSVCFVACFTLVCQVKSL